MKLRSPVTEIRATPREATTGPGSHVDLQVWVNHALAGTLTVRWEEEAAMLALFTVE